MHAAKLLQSAYRHRKLRHLIYRRRLIRFERRVVVLQKHWRCVVSRKIFNDKLFAILMPILLNNQNRVII